MRSSWLYIVVLLGISACQQEDKVWAFSNKITLPESVRPLGLAMSEEGLWISDPDNQRILLINDQGEVLKSIEGLERPMHIQGVEDKLFIPQFGNDTIVIIENGSRSVLQLSDSIDAPSGVAFQEGTFVIADFYNNRVLSVLGNKILVIGEKGNKEGQFYYPTDVDITRDRILVADAYNNRIQLFDLNGKFVNAFGKKENINVATGIDAFEGQVYVTDYYGNRVLIYDMTGVLIQVFAEDFSKPTEVLVTDDMFYVSNYGENTVSVFKR